jgi:hypothetical protein
MADGWRGMARLAMLTIVVVAGRLAAAAPACSGLEPIAPAVEAERDPSGKPKILSVSAAELQRQAGELGRDAPGERETRGLTVNRLEGQAGYTLARIARPGSATCVALKAVTGQLANRDVTILLDRRYPQGSCERRAILDHELEHVRINDRALVRGERLLRDRLAKAAAGWRGRWLPEDQAKEIDDAIGKVVSGVVGRVRADARREHAQLDTPESYAQTQRRCRHW